MANDKKQNQKAQGAANDEAEVPVTDTVQAGKDVGRAPAGLKMSAANPGENMPVFVPGKNWKVGDTLTGRYISTERVYSNKFTAGKKDKDGKIYRDLHTLEDLTDKSLFGIWSVGILGNFFNQVPLEAPVSITYKGLGEEAFKPGQSVPHTFEFAIGEGYRLQRGAGIVRPGAQAAQGASAQQ